MSIWGSSQKVGRPLIETAPNESPDTSFPNINKRKPIGGGNDERALGLDPENADSSDCDWNVVANIARNFQQKELLQLLQSKQVGIVEKIARVRSASLGENLLPSSFVPEAVQAPSLRAGGLTKDWDFEF